MVEIDKQNNIKMGIMLGDHAGIGPEIVAKTLRKKDYDYIPVLIGNKRTFEKCMTGLNLKPFSEIDEAMCDNTIYFVDIPSEGNICPGQITADSGRLIYDSLVKSVDLQRKEIIDGIVMAPITKQALHKAGFNYSSEFELFADLYKVPHVGSVVKCENIFRSTVVGHCRFTEIVDSLSSEKIANTARGLLNVMREFLPEERCNIAVAALNPHAGEDGLFGDEESRIIKPAIDMLIKEGENVIGPCPADTVFLKALHNEVGGVVFLYHDQGNIAMKSSFFGDGVLVYTNVPAVICSVGHGSALDIAGKNLAKEANIEICINTAVQICRNKRETEVKM